jgi:acetyl-CoA C-acetyltransferase
MLVHDSLLAGAYEIGVAGGQESMSNAPYLLPKARGGYRLGHGQMLDHMFLDGLEDAYNKDAKGGGRLMGTFAEECAESYGFTRQAQDAFAIQSTTRAQKAINEGLFKWEIAPVTIVGKKGDVVVDKDEQPLKAQIEKIPGLKPAFKKDGTVTAANSSSISDGAAAVVLMKASKAKSLGLAPIARIVGHTTHAQEPNLFTTAPVFAIEKLLKKNGWSVADVDLWEINEAFAVVTMAAIHDLKLDPAKVNVHGGACALGHPIGASGARILVSLIGALKQYGKTRGVASLCIGGGEAVAVGVEMLKEQ